MASMRGQRLLAVSGALAVGLVITPAAAHAAPVDQIGLKLEDVLVPVGPTAKGATVTLENPSDVDVDLRNVKVVVDSSGLAGIATVQSPRPTFAGRCDTAGTKVTCTYDHLNVSIIDAYPVFMDLKSVAGATVGQRGTYRVTAEADGLPARAATATVTLAEGVNLVAGPDVTLAGPAGATLSLAPSVRNAGGTAVHGAVLSSSAGYKSAKYGPKFSNCQYTDEQFYCVFDEDLAPGKEYVPAEGVSVVLGGDSPAPSTFDTYAEWQTPDDAVPGMESIRRHGAKPGNGPKLRLVEKPPSVRANAQTDIHEIDDFTHVVVNVTGQNLPDGAGVGTTVRGEVGQTVTARVGVKNLGPARLDFTMKEFPGAYIVVPAGTTVVAIDDRSCAPAKDGKVDRSRKELLGAAEYRCLALGIDVGQTATWDIGLRIDDAAPSVGKISARTETLDDDKFGPDRDPANNTADILVNPPAGAGGGTGTAAIGGLPVTGARVGYAAAAGIVLTVLGVGAYLAARRRRTRFIA